LYSCLANGSADEFQKGEHLYKTKSVKEALQIGTYLYLYKTSKGNTGTMLTFSFLGDKLKELKLNITDQ
jgi:hypothetical protein